MSTNISNLIIILGKMAHDEIHEYTCLKCPLKSIARQYVT